MSHKRLTYCVVVGLLFGGMYLFFPLFRVMPLGSGDSRVTVPVDGPLSAAEFARQFWEEVLPNSFDQAVELTELFQLLDHDIDLARQLHGRQIGIGGKTYFFVQGAGEVQESQSNRLLLSIEGHERQVRIETGVLFGNAVRDGTGLIDVSMFPNSQEFNALSAELNQRVETEVIAPLQGKIAVGDHLQFVGCVQSRSDRDLNPLSVIPVRLHWNGREEGP